MAPAPRVRYPAPMSWLLGLTSLALAFTLCGLGNTVGYHRLLTHRGFTARPWLRALLTLLGASYSGSPAFWVGLHRLHHLRSDGEEDPHSPTRGFWWAHCGWLLGSPRPWLCAPYALSGFGQQLSVLIHDLRRLAGRNPPTWHALTKDLMKERLIRLLDAPLVMPALFALQLGLAWAVGGPWGLAWLWALHVALTNASWAVNSICHTEAFGTQPYDTGDQSRDVPWLALPTLGESFHNAHHRFPRSARHGLEGGFDPSWRVIQGLERLGQVSEIWLPKKYRS